MSAGASMASSAPVPTLRPPFHTLFEYLDHLRLDGTSPKWINISSRVPGAACVITLRVKIKGLVSPGGWKNKAGHYLSHCALFTQPLAQAIHLGD